MCRMIDIAATPSFHNRRNNQVQRREYKTRYADRDKIHIHLNARRNHQSCKYHRRNSA